MKVMPNRVVIVGASAAGLTAAKTLRHRGYDGAVTLIGDEPHPPTNGRPRVPLTGESRAVERPQSDLQERTRRSSGGDRG
jgi:NADPH-dependent 2,4-dienoyl-CoA reductase/sulfur reductase-like enzyme